MPYVKEPFKWGTFIVNTSAIGLAVYLYEQHQINVYFWVAWLFGVEPGWAGALAGVVLGILCMFAVILATSWLQRFRCYRIRFRNRTKLGWIREHAILGALYYFGFAWTASLVWMTLLLIG